jgi:hypothetical protein
MSLITNIPNCSWKSAETGQTTNSQLASCFAELQMAASGQSEVTAFEPKVRLGAHQYTIGALRAMGVTRSDLPGIDKPWAAHPPVCRMLPVPLTNTLSTTIAKHDWPLLALLTAPPKVTLECGG